MINRVVSEVICECRDVLIRELTEQLNDSGGFVELTAVLPYDKERQESVETVDNVFVGDDGEAYVRYHDESGESFCERIDMFTLDEIIKIIEEM